MVCERRTLLLSPSVDLFVLQRLGLRLGPLQVTKSQRDIEREIRTLDRQEKQMQLEAKKLANQGQVRYASALRPLVLSLFI